MTARPLFYPQFLCFLVAFVASGCGPDLGKPVVVEGRVTLDGKGLPQVNVSFVAIEGEMPAEKRSVSGVTDSTGVYQLKDVYPADYQVSITEAVAASPAPVPGAPPGQALVLANPAAGTPLDKYQPGKSTLKAQVTEDNSNFDFELGNAGSTPPAK